MFKSLEKIKKSATSDINAVIDRSSCQAVESKYLGKNGILIALLKTISSFSRSERPLFGKEVNLFKTMLITKIQEKKDLLGLAQSSQKDFFFDLTLPAENLLCGNLHPITKIMEECVQSFLSMGFQIETGPEIETTFYNFDALNILEDHPSREMHDTFYLKDGHLLRTHTSPVQIRAMERKTPPFRMIAPGKVYRRDSDITHSPVFHQLEGLCVDRHLSFADLKGVLSLFLKNIFGSDVAIRFRPSYFPFTRPSAEIDISCLSCNQKGCRVCSKTGWLEILGAGMVSSAVFRSVNYSVEKWSGFAFGVGIERIAMLKWGIDDIRLFYENNIRFLEQF